MDGEGSDVRELGFTSRFLPILLDLAIKIAQIVPLVLRTIFINVMVGILDNANVKPLELGEEAFDEFPSRLPILVIADFDGKGAQEVSSGRISLEVLIETFVDFFKLSESNDRICSFRIFADCFVAYKVSA